MTVRGLGLLIPFIPASSVEKSSSDAQHSNPLRQYVGILLLEVRLSIAVRLLSAGNARPGTARARIVPTTVDIKERCEAAGFSEGNGE